MGNRSRPIGPRPCEEGGPCFCLFGKLHKHLRSIVHGNSSDPIGTPIPDTPQYFRRRREQSKGSFLEQEDSERDLRYSRGYEHGLGRDNNNVYSQSNVPSSNSISNSSNSNGIAQVYEGQNAESRLLAKYELLEVLGVGSTSAVHRCRNRNTLKEFACKIIDCKLIDERFRGMMAQFRTEIDALRQLQHPGIIRLFDVYISKEKIYIVMELMEGGELFDYVVQKGTLTEEEASKIVRKVTSALVYMHDKNIIHRDLKPENLLLKKKPTSSTSDVDVKIIDFGLSKVLCIDCVAIALPMVLSLLLLS